METRDRFRGIVDQEQALDPVPCRTCTACCRHNQIVELRWEWGDDPSLYVRKEPTLVSGRLGLVLSRRPNGDCAYLGEAGCTIYEQRPVVCRGFDCRRNWLSYDADQRAEAIQRRSLPAEVFREGEARLASLKLSPGEDAFWNSRLGERLLNGRTA